MARWARAHAGTHSAVIFVRLSKDIPVKKNLSGCVFFTIVIAATVLTGCRLDSEQVQISDGNLYGVAENTILTCSDGIDNDNNGYKDCEDPNCKTRGTAEAPGPGDTVCPDQEDNIYVCSDGLDNDGDGFIDCEDNSCKSTASCCVATGDESTEEECSDGIDNDCSGLADCADPTCKNSSDPDVQAYCRKILEDLANAAIPNLPTAIPEFNAELCSDGKDNDFNGVADCADPNCIALNLEYCSVKLTQEPPARPANFATLSASARAAILANEKDLCTDNIDNDRDGLVDCEEYQCMLRSLQTLTGDEAVYQFTCQTSTAQ